MKAKREEKVLLKRIFKGIIMYPMTVYVLYRWAFSEKQAKVLMAAEIARKQGINVAIVLRYMKENPLKVKITVETEVREIDDEGEETVHNSKQTSGCSQVGAGVVRA